LKERSEELRCAPYPWLAPAYFVVYLGYLFYALESELGHWLGLVTVPALLIAVALRIAGQPAGFAAVLRTFGLERDRLRRGVPLAIIIGVTLGAAQLLISRQRDVFLGLVTSGRALWLLPLALAFTLLTAGFTEEFFFRGFLQNRLEQITSSRFAAVLLASLAFGVYHLPYAYFNPHWPSAGNWGAAWSAAMGQGFVGGLILGAVYLKAGRNLLAPTIVHALIIAFPASTMIHFGPGGS
jgi:membrane protease YdiL (CAAX protease family)